MEHLIRDEEPQTASDNQPAAAILDKVEAERKRKEEEEESMPEMQSVFSDSEDESEDQKPEETVD